MSDINIAISIIEAEAREDINAAKTVKDKFKAAFSRARNHYMFTDEDIQFRAAIGAVLIVLDKDSDDYNRVLKEVHTLNTLSAALSGIPVNFNQMEIDFEPIGPMKLWKGQP